MLLLGYALVEVPRSMWNASKRGYSLHYAYFHAAKLSCDKCEAQDAVDDVLEVIIIIICILYCMVGNILKIIFFTIIVFSFSFIDT